MSHPLCGFIYELQIPGAEATHVLVLTEDIWNARMLDSVVVPLYHLPDASASLFLVEVGSKLKANCTRVQSMSHQLIGTAAVARCPEDAWLRVRIGVRKFLDIDRRIAKMPAKPPVSPRADWWPRQNEIHFARNPAISSNDKLYGVISDDDWNSRAGAQNVAAVRLTSKTKANRLRWEVPVSGGFVIAGDVYSVAVGDFEQTPPPSKYPARLTDDETAAVATKQKAALTLS